MSEFVLGVLAGIVSSVVMGLLAWVWPIILAWSNKETKIAGEWKWFDCTSNESVGAVTIKQRGEHVTGEFIRSKSGDGQTTSRRFTFTGTIYGHTLILSYREPEDPKNIRGAIILRVVSGRADMYGKTMYFDGYRGKISTINFFISRKERLSDSAKEYLSSGELPISSKEHETQNTTK